LSQEAHAGNLGFHELAEQLEHEVEDNLVMTFGLVVQLIGYA